MKTTLTLSLAAGAAMLLAGCNCPMNPQPQGPGPGPDSFPTITVSATGEVKAAPDQAQFAIQLLAQAPTGEAASNTLNGQANSLVEHLKSKGVLAKNIQTTAIRLNPQYDHRPQPPVPANAAPKPPQIVGYEASYTVNVTLNDLAKASQLVGGITALPGVTRVDGPNLTFADTTRLEGEALADAVRKARRKAELLAAEAGMTVGEPWTINAQGDGYVPMNRAPMMMAARMEKAAPPPIEAGEDTFRASVTVTFRAGPKR